MNNSFHKQNRTSLYSRLQKNSAAVLFSGAAPRKTNDQYYPFYTDRNFIYLTGIDQNNAALLSVIGDNSTSETLFIPPPDKLAERWNGERIKPDIASEQSGITDIKHNFEPYINRLLASGDIETVYLPLFKHTAEEPDDPAFKLARFIRDRFPFIIIKDLLPHIKAQRLIKKPAEIEAMRKAEELTREGITAMMKITKPGLMEYHLKAEFEYTLMKHGVQPASAPIISAGANNFSIHYHGHNGRLNDGDLVLNDVGAVFDNVMTDVSRAYPVNGKFSERQKLLYNCAYETSEYMFGIIKSGMPMSDIDGIIKKYNFEKLKEIGLCKTIEDVGTYMWHGGAHHVGFDVHDPVAIKPETPIAPGMVFCVDIGIYVEDWGIGFRLEDNCLVTETGNENLSANIPRTIKEIEEII